MSWTTQRKFYCSEIIATQEPLKVGFLPLAARDQRNSNQFGYYLAQLLESLPAIITPEGMDWN